MHAFHVPTWCVRSQKTLWGKQIKTNPSRPQLGSRFAQLAVSRSWRLVQNWSFWCCTWKCTRFINLRVILTANICEECVLEVLVTKNLQKKQKCFNIYSNYFSIVCTFIYSICWLQIESKKIYCSQILWLTMKLNPWPIQHWVSSSSGFPSNS